LCSGNRGKEKLRFLANEKPVPRTTPKEAIVSLKQRIEELESQLGDARKSPEPFDHSSRLITGLRKINKFVQLVEHSESVSDLCREAVLFVHHELGAERCGLYIVETGGLRGAWGIDANLQLVSEEECFLPQEDYSQDWAEVHDPNDAKWKLLKSPLREWRDGKPHILSHGWLARTSIHSNGRLVGVLFNDTLVSKSPPDPVLQEVLAVFGGLLGRMLESLRARNELERREAESRQFLEHLPDLVVRYNREGVHLYASSHVSRLFGIALEEIIGRRWRDVPVPPELAGTWEIKLEELFQSQSPVLFEFDIPTPKGVRRISSRLVPEVHHGEGLSTTALGVLSDVTEQRDAEEALVESERRYRRAIIQAGLIPYERMLEDDSFTYIGEGIEELTGIQPGNMSLSGLRRMTQEVRLRGPLSDLSLTKAFEEIRSGKRREWRADIRILNHRGEALWLADCACMTRDERTGTSWVLGFLQNITESVRVEADLVTSQHRLALVNRIGKSIQGNLSLSEILAQVTSEIHDFFPQYRVSYTRISAEGRMEVLCSRQPASLPSIEGVALELGPDAPEEYQLNNLVPSVVHDCRVEEVSDRCRGTAHTINMRSWITVPMMHDETSIGVLCLASDEPCRWQENELQTMLEIADYLKLVVRDSLLRHRREASEKALAESREMLLQSQKLDAIARLAGGIAHDFNNLLTVISGNIELMAEEVADLGHSIEGLEDIRNAVSRASSLTSQLLNYGRRQFVQPVTFHLGDRLQLLNKILRRSLHDDIVFTTDIEENLRPLFADPAQIDQMIVNLVINASEAMPDGGTLAITARNVLVEESGKSPWEGINPGWHVELSIRDTGLGIPPADISRIFEPFYSSKHSPAAGLGLASAFGVVKKFNGDIRVESTPGIGTEFSVIFPVSKVEMKTAAAIADDTASTGNETILLIEDEASLLALSARTLRAFGYRVLEAQSGSEAIEIFRIMSEEIDILVTDVVMPGISGPELAAQLIAQRPELPVLYISGYSAEDVVRRGVELGSLQFLGKPFSPRALGQRIRSILDESGQRSPSASPA
jgi:PAS domain S-box-containing protein